MYKRISSPNIDKLYETETSIILCREDANTKSDDEENICKVNRGMNCECSVNKCHAKCNNCEMGNYLWKNVYVHNSRIHGFGLFESDDIKKGEFIIEYLGKEYAKCSNKTEYDTYQMEMGKHYIDAREEGSLARFINHHDPANAKFEKKLLVGLRDVVYLRRTIFLRTMKLHVLI